ncbi:MAG: hypothetical protein GF308_18995 [Candidatus Heimdallarchaeota archaeon]|nr:hypothetical protein [Candidatus Heimdallarchaeota archaeon]
MRTEQISEVHFIGNLLRRSYDRVILQSENTRNINYSIGTMIGAINNGICKVYLILFCDFRERHSLIRQTSNVLIKLPTTEIPLSIVGLFLSSFQRNKVRIVRDSFSIAVRELYELEKGYLRSNRKYYRYLFAEYYPYFEKFRIKKYSPNKDIRGYQTIRYKEYVERDDISNILIKEDLAKIARENKLVAIWPTKIIKVGQSEQKNGKVFSQPRKGIESDDVQKPTRTNPQEIMDLQANMSELLENLEKTSKMIRIIEEEINQN